MNTDIALGEQEHGQENNPPALSIVVLTCNSSSTIEECLDSLVNQDFTDFETIVVDDGSVDETVSIVSCYSSRLRLSIVPNGSHNIPRGRNIGLGSSKSNLVAFLDSDDYANHDWTQVIAKTFEERPELALIAGDLIPAYRTRTSHAIALNDATVRQLTSKGAMKFTSGNCSVNQRILPGAIFDEEFRAAEDLELFFRVQRKFPCCYIPEMKVYHTSRDSFDSYAKQMYRYGFMKLYLEFCERSYRLIDFVPLSLMILSVLASVVFGSWWIIFSIIPFSLLEALFVIAYKRCRPSIGILIFPAWITKNIAWSVGIGNGILSLLIHPETRHRLRSKRAGCR